MILRRTQNASNCLSDISIFFSSRIGGGWSDLFCIISQDIGKHLAELSRAAQDILEKAKETSECSVKSQVAAAVGATSIQELLDFLRQVIESNQSLNRAMDFFERSRALWRKCDLCAGCSFV